MHIKKEDRFRIISIDPSTSHTGFAVIEVDLSNGNINIPFASTFNRSSLIRGCSWMTDVYGEKEVAIYCYGNILRGLLEAWEPSLVVMEAPYLSRMPAAFKALSEIVSTFTQTVMAWDQTVRVLQFDPATVKKGMGVSGKSGDKELMRTALSTSQLPIYYSGVNIHELDEHSVDAICVGLFVAKDLYR